MFEDFDFDRSRERKCECERVWYARMWRAAALLDGAVAQQWARHIARKAGVRLSPCDSWEIGSVVVALRDIVGVRRTLEIGGGLDLSDVSAWASSAAEPCRQTALRIALYAILLISAKRGEKAAIDWLNADFGEHDILGCEDCLNADGCYYMRYPISELSSACTEEAYVNILAFAVQYSTA